MVKNYHDDVWIMNHICQHYNTALGIFPKDQIIGVFLQGSQNYNLDYENSDVDTKCIIVPTIKDLCLNRKPVSYTHVNTDNSHIDFKDLRIIVNDFRKQNINFLEILFSPYVIFNSEYYPLFKPLLDNAEKIAHYDACTFVKAVSGMSNEKKKGLLLDRPSQHIEIETYGWAVKQLHHLIRLNHFMKRYIEGSKFEDCLIDSANEGLRILKTNGHEYLKTEEAIAIAEKYDKETENLKNLFIAKTIKKIDSDVDILIDNTVVNILKASLKKELLKGER